MFPQRLNTTLEYVDNLTLSTPGSSPNFGTEIAYRLNSLFDPYFSVGGHQPYGFDQIAAMYNRYMVNSVDVELTFTDPSTDGLYVGVMMKNFYDPTTLQGTGIGAASEKPTIWTRPLNNTGSQVVTFKKHIDLAEMMGLTRQQYEGGWFALSGLVSTDPAQTPYMATAIADSRSGSSQTVICSVKLLFHSTFWGRKLPASS